MRFLYLLFIFLFSTWAVADGGFAGCTNPKVDSICSETCGEGGCEAETPEETPPATPATTAPAAGAVEGAPAAVEAEAGPTPPNCEKGHLDAQGCCNDPVNCLGGDNLSTFQEVNNIATQVGPGLSMLMQGTGKDMSGMCEALQAMAGAGAGLSTAALVKCKGSISSCRSTCDQEIKINCTEYKTAQITCTTESESLNNRVSAHTKFANTASKNVPLITKAYATKPACTALNAKATEIMGNVGQMANSALSAELCKQQASATQTKEECAKAGGRLDAYSRCITPEGDCEKEDGIWDGIRCKSQEQVCLEKGWRWNRVECKDPVVECAEAGGQWNAAQRACREIAKATVNRGDGNGNLNDQYGSGINLNTETPGNNENEYDPDDPDNNDVGGGGSTPAGISGGSPSSDLLSGLKDSSGTSPSTDSSSTSGTAGSKIGSSGGIRGGFGRGFSGRRPAERASRSGGDDDKPGLSMGGGGFSGYGGGGSGDGDSYASLGLSKKKLKELEKKAGAKRKTASEGLGGAHQNIFERITKRFQSLCQNKLDCR